MIKGISFGLLITFILGCTGHKPQSANSKENQLYYKVYSIKDSVEIGQKWIGTIEIDKEEIKDFSKVKALYLGVPLKRTDNKFELELTAIVLGIQKLEVKLVRYDHNPIDTTKIQLSYFGLWPKNAKPIDYVLTPDQMPIFKANGYSTFDDYIVVNLKAEKLTIQGKLVLICTILETGEIRIEGIINKTVSDIDKEKISTIIKNCNCWIPGYDKGKKVKVLVTNIFNFK